MRGSSPRKMFTDGANDAATTTQEGVHAGLQGGGGGTLPEGDRSIPEVARDLDLTETAVRRWVTQAEIDRGSRPGLTSSEQAELAQLRRENRQLREDLGIMKRAAAFFAKETR
jgi:transposase